MSASIAYIEPHQVVKELWGLAPDYFSPSVCGQHYCRSARHYFKLALADDRMHVKHIFYALRAILALNWIEKTDSPVPMNF